MMKRIKRNLTGWLIVLTAGLFSAQPVSGHFVWVAKDAKSGEMKIYFGEGPEPDQKMFLKGIAKMQTWQRGQNDFVAAKFEEKSDGDEGWLVAGTSPNCNEFLADVTYGLFSKGESSMLLHYSAKYGAVGLRQPLSRKSSQLLSLDILASVVEDKIVFQVVQAKKPVANGELLVVDRDGKTHEVKTGPHGKWSLPRKSGRYLVRAKVGKAIAGQYQGQEYTEKRNYCTLVLDVGEVLDVNDLPVGQGKGARTSGKKKLADLPKGLTSFGGAVSNNRVFISGGHTGKAHSYYESGQNQTLYALDLDHPDQWKKIADGLGLQGLALVAHKGSLYRIGGFHAHNKEGETQDLRSVKDFAVFDFEKKAWKQLEPMPVGRSSFDAVVVKGKVYVVGGWTMNGAAETQWCGTAISLDLNGKNAKWERLPDPPFKRRALSVGFQKNKLIVIGGMQPKGGPTQKVSLYDLGSKEWTEGPLLPGEEAMEGFGSSCFNVGGQLIVSTYGGNVLRMKDDFSSWETIERLDEGRFFHRLLPLNQSEFILVGGANMEVGKFHEIKVLSKD